MRKVALALAAAGTLALTAPAFANSLQHTGDGKIRLAEADVKVKVTHGKPRVKKKIVIRHDRRHDRRWRHRHGTSKTVIIKKKRPAARVVIKKKNRHGDTVVIKKRVER